MASALDAPTDDIQTQLKKRLTSGTTGTPTPGWSADPTAPTSDTPKPLPPPGQQPAPAWPVNPSPVASAPTSGPAWAVNASPIDSAPNNASWTASPTPVTSAPTSGPDWAVSSTPITSNAAPVTNASAPVSTTEPVAPPVAQAPTASAAPPFSAGMQQVATAPDGVPVYSVGGKYYTRNPDGSMTEQFQGGTPDWLSGPKGWTGNAQDWVTSQLGAVQSSDDPGYWLQKIQSDPKAMAGDPSALSYWSDRIRRGNGSSLVKNGSLGLFNDSGQGTPGQTPAVSPFTQQIRDILMKRLKDASGPVNETDQQIAQPFQAAQLQSDRGAQQANAIAAEQAYAASARGGGGIDQGALGRQGQQAAEQQATGLAGIKSQLIQKAYAQKQSELQSDLQMALASGDAETARAIQVELANLQAQLTREGYGIQLAGITNQQNTAPFSLFS